jgi:hypothetical protein
MSDKRERPTEGLPPPATPYLPVQNQGVHVTVRRASAGPLLTYDRWISTLRWRGTQPIRPSVAREPEHVVRHRGQQTIGERPNVRGTERHVARTKAGPATVPVEAGRQRGTQDPCGPGTPTRTRRPKRKVNPCGGSHSRVEIRPPAMGRMGAPRLVCDGEGSTPDQNSGLRSGGRPGVAGWACGEGLLEKGGRSREEPGGAALSVRPPTGGGAAIGVNPERRPGASWEVRVARSSDEAAVTAGDAKGPHFGAARGGGRGRPSHREV